MNHAWPGGVELRPPNPDRPRWSTDAGTRIHYSQLIAGAEADDRLRLAVAHAEAIVAVVREAITGHEERKRELIAAASRLCHETLGQVPGRGASWRACGGGGPRIAAPPRGRGLGGAKVPAAHRLCGGVFHSEGG